MGGIIGGGLSSTSPENLATDLDTADRIKGLELLHSPLSDRFF